MVRSTVTLGALFGASAACSEGPKTVMVDPDTAHALDREIHPVAVTLARHAITLAAQPDLPNRMVEKDNPSSEDPSNVLLVYRRGSGDGQEIAEHSVTVGLSRRSGVLDPETVSSVIIGDLNCREEGGSQTCIGKKVRLYAPDQSISKPFDGKYQPRNAWEATYEFTDGTGTVSHDTLSESGFITEREGQPPAAQDTARFIATETRALFDQAITPA
jgi:hypothetical protein